MKVLILHGILGKAGENWGQWLSDSLLKQSYEVIMPNLPKPDHPNRQEWLDSIKSVMPDTSDLIIVAHSLGVTSALDFIEQLDSPIVGLVSVSGFAEDYGFELNSYFLEQKIIDFNKVNANLERAVVFYGDNDPYVTQKALALLARDLKVKPTIIKNGGHLNSSAGYTKFPALLESIISLN
jgi:predicted alpha/beta hydrolase family esterase